MLGWASVPLSVWGSLVRLFVLGKNKGFVSLFALIVSNKAHRESGSLGECNLSFGCITNDSGVVIKIRIGT